MRIAIVGVGGVGGYYGARLLHAKQDVHFIARGATLGALRADGLTVDGVSGTFSFPRVDATDRCEEVGPAGLVLVAIKTWQVPAVARQILPLVGEETCVLPLLNGVEAADQLADVLGDEAVLAGLTRIIAFQAAPARIRHAGADPYIALGERHRRNGQRAERIRRILADAGIAAEVPADIMAALWQKFLFVAAWGTVGALSRMPLGAIRTCRESRQLLIDLMQEIAAVAAASGVCLPGDVVQKTLELIGSLPATGTTSLQRDLADGKRSELDAWTGAIVRLGERAGVPTPIARIAYSALLPVERAARG